MVEFKVGVPLALGFGRRLTEGVGLAQVGLVELVLVGHISGLGEHTLLLQQGHDTEGLLNQLDGSGKIKTEIDKDPVDAFPLVLFLLEDEHMVVEKLLELLVGEVDAQLLKGVELENLEA